MKKCFLGIIALTLIGYASCGMDDGGTLVIVNTGIYTLTGVHVFNGSDTQTVQGGTSIAAGTSKAFDVQTEYAHPWYEIYVNNKFARHIFVANGETVTVEF